MISFETMKEQIPFWDRLDEEEKQKLAESARRESFRKGERIDRASGQCRGMIRILSGRLRTYFLSEEGREITLFFLPPDEICVLSASCLMNTVSFEVFIEAVEDTELLLLPSAMLHGIMENNPEVELFLSRTANSRLSDAMQAMQRVLFLSAEARVALFLLEEAQLSGKEEISCTHEEIARFIGSAREVVSKTLKGFVAEGILKTGRGKIEILDGEKLKKKGLM